MAENKIELMTVQELNGMKFFIPNYQRGYRWTRQQINDLLDDIEEFRQQKNEEKDDFYCLQPLVIKERIIDAQKFIDTLPKSIDAKDILSATRNAITNCTKCEVIDGQQRLTTIYILLKYLSKDSTDSSIGYNIEYETRDGFDDFLTQLVKQPPVETDNNISIDFYYISEAYKSIYEWFDGKKDEDKKEFLETLLCKVKFIWYQAVDEDPIKVFTRLNIGKIKLTNSELIKALFLKRSNFGGEKDVEHQKFRQQEIASQWDQIEATLQNEEFWLFLHEKEYGRPTRIDFIFDMICEQEVLGRFSDLGNDDYKTFRYFYKYFKSPEHDIKKCWAKVAKYFQTFQEWYGDLELYHYVGFLIDQGAKVATLHKEWSDKKDKKSFVEYLKEQIKLELKDCCNLNQQYEIDKIDKKVCKPLLLLHNIQTIINQHNAYKQKEEYQRPVFYKFPFHLYKRERWDVEHIDSNSTNELSSELDRKEWLIYALLDNSLEEKIKTEIYNYIIGKPNESFEQLFGRIEQSYSGWEEPESDKNKIWNFVLLDAGTNRSYGNAIFPAKRCCIIGRDRGVNLRDKIRKISKKRFNTEADLQEEIKPESLYKEDDIVDTNFVAFIPPVTKNVFLKYYSMAVSSFKAWTMEDAIAYRNNIYETLKVFGVINPEEDENK